MAYCHSSYFPKQLFSGEAAIRWREDVGQWQMNPAEADCERYDASRECPRGPCGARTGWAFIPGQIANWRWSVDYDAPQARHFQGPFYEAQRATNYCGNAISPGNSHLSWNRLLP